MASSSRVDFSLGGVKRAVAKVRAAQSRAEQIEARATATLVRRLKPEASRVVSRDVLNLSPSRVSPHLKVEKRSIGSAAYVSLSAARTRLPLILYNPRFSRHDGVTATTWRELGPQRYPQAFKRADRKGVWQRIPTRKGSSDLVARLPIVERKGPSVHRVFESRGRYAGHGDVIPKLSTFVEQTLSLEIARLLRAP